MLAEKGEVISNADGLASISFMGVYSTKPHISFTSEYTADDVMVGIESWVQDAEGNYVGVNIRTRDDGGRPEKNVKVLWAIFIEVESEVVADKPSEVDLKEVRALIELAKKRGWIT